MINIEFCIFENLGVKLIRDAVLQTRNRFGDGAKTTALLIEALLEEGIASIQQGIDPQEFRRGMLFAEKHLQAGAVPPRGELCRVYDSGGAFCQIGQARELDRGGTAIFCKINFGSKE